MEEHVSRELLPIYHQLGALDATMKASAGEVHRLAELGEQRETRSQQFRETTAAALARIEAKLDSGNTPAGTSSVIARSAQAGPITASVSFGTGWLRRGLKALAAAVLGALGLSVLPQGCRPENSADVAAPP